MSFRARRWAGGEPTVVIPETGGGGGLRSPPSGWSSRDVGIERSASLPRDCLQPGVQAGERWVRVLPRSRSKLAGKQQAEPGLMLQRFDPDARRRPRSRRPAPAARRGSARQAVASPRGTGVLVPIEIVDQRVSLGVGCRIVAGERAFGARHGGVDRGERGGGDRSVRVVERVLEDRLAGCRRLRDRCGRVRKCLPISCFRGCPPLPGRATRAKPAWRNAQPGFAAAIRRRARNTACGPGQFAGGGRECPYARCGERDPRDGPVRLPATGWPQASVKWLRAIKPSRIGLVARRSSRRASASSAATSGPASWAQGSGSGIL